MQGVRHFKRRSLVQSDPESEGALRPLTGSAGAYWSATRCAASESRAHFGIGKDVYSVPLEDAELGSSDQGNFVVGKDDVYLPIESPRPLVVEPSAAFAHRYEVQSVANWVKGGVEFVASVDGAGGLCVCEFHDGAAGSDSRCPERSYQAKPPAASAMEVGWAGRSSPSL